MRNWSRQEVNSYLSMLFVGVLAFGASCLIINMAAQERLSFASPQITELIIEE